MVAEEGLSLTRRERRRKNGLVEGGSRRRSGGGLDREMSLLFAGL